MSKKTPLSTLALCFALTVIAFFVIDVTWLAFVARDFYGAQLGELFAKEPRWGVAILVYVLYILGIVIFACRPGLASGSVKTAAIYGALFGFFCYMTYDLTNLATVEGWPVKMAIVDIIWGTVLTASCAAIAVWGTQMIIDR